VCGETTRAADHLRDFVSRTLGDSESEGAGAMGYRVATVGELQDIAYRQDTHMRPVRHHLGITAFGANAWTAADVGDRLMPEHREDDGNEELYVVLRGRARFEIDGDVVDAPQGTLVFVRPEGNRTAFAEEAGTTVLAIGSTVGKPYEAGGWEVWAEFHPAYEAGDYEAVIDRARETVEASGYAAPLYNLACCEALAGRREAAIGHLRVAFERRPGLRDLAKEDTDLDPLRDEPAFRELVG
jgi:mannose-6-phosphate isomerase-like protein (cupin superfamily)